MNGFLVQLQCHPHASITCQTVVQDGVFCLQVGRNFFRTTPEETAQILRTPGFEAMPSVERQKVILDVVTALSSLEEDPVEMHTKHSTAQRRPRAKKEGSFLVIALTPRHYTYARKLRGLAGYALYDMLTTEPLSRKDVERFSQCAILLTVGLVFTPVWPSIDWLPLSDNRSWISYWWTADSLPPADKEWARGVRNPETEFFLVTSWYNPAEHRAYSKQTPVKREALYGLQRWGLTTPTLVEEKLRLHYGLTPTGEAQMIGKWPSNC